VEDSAIRAVGITRGMGLCREFEDLCVDLALFRLRGRGEAPRGAPADRADSPQGVMPSKRSTSLSTPCALPIGPKKNACK
jgi:hypothetical protein